VIRVRRTPSGDGERQRENLTRRHVESDLLDRFLEQGAVIANVVPARGASRRMAQETPDQLVGHTGGAEPRRE
jgi:hypothetical protein